MRIKVVLFLVIVSLIFPLFPVSGQPSGELVIALPNDPTGIFIANASDVTAISATRPLYDGLVVYGADGSIQPGLAESWDISEDGRTYTFHLREGVTFHNGEDFNAHAVGTIWEYGMTPTNQWLSYYDSVASAEDIVVIDDYTVQITTSEADAFFLSEMANGWFAIPPGYLAEVGLEAFEASPVGTGPFMLEHWAPGDRIVMRAFPDYWNPEQPKVERLTFRIIPDATTRMAAIQTGEVDIVTRLNTDDVALLEFNPDVNIVSYPNDRVYYVAFKNIGNGVGTPLENELVRQALNLAVDREGLVAALFSGNGQTVSGFVIPSNLGYDPSLLPYPHDPQRARELLAEAGYPDGFGIGMSCPADAYTNINEVCLSVQRDLGAIGVDVDLEFKTTNAFWSEAHYATTGPMYVDSWSSPNGEAFWRLEGSLTPGYYYSTWTDPDIVDYLGRIAQAVDREERAALYAELSHYMYDDPPYIYLYILNLFEATTKRVTGYQPLPNETFYLNEVGVDG
ncbi:MAG: ABC transporter substrate-binding protein [Anaerolineaceae bacterium]|nr:ABC transporter substrate-binding protein [Anaerolineaceae bacterium]MDE0328502.1 ABC transporter substrate-binding protein [Anaerolineaceae bacterium]